MRYLPLVWLGILATGAAWAPFLANSAPLLAIDSENGQWISPALSLLRAEDVGWLVGWGCGIWAWRARARGWRVFVGAAAVTAVGWGTAAWGLSPPAVVSYEQWRMAEQKGAIKVLVRAPIPYSPRDYLRDFGSTVLEPPLASVPTRWHWLGTDAHGADVAARLVYASRTALTIGLVATGVALAIGVAVGAIMGYFAGWVDLIGMRLVEIFEAVPTLFLLLAFVAFFERSLVLMMGIIGLTAWPTYARYARAEFLRLRRAEFVLWAESAGLPLRSILFRHMLPNAVAPLVVATAFGVASAILAETTLSFLGLGAIDEPSWGELLNQAVRSATFHWWLALFPGGAVLLTVLSYNLLGEALRDRLDPRLQGEQIGG